VVSLHSEKKIQKKKECEWHLSLKSSKLPGLSAPVGVRPVPLVGPTAGEVSAESSDLGWRFVSRNSGGLVFGPHRLKSLPPPSGSSAPIRTLPPSENDPMESLYSPPRQDPPAAPIPSRRSQVAPWHWGSSLAGSGGFWMQGSSPTVSSGSSQRMNCFSNGR
jgi:hypothetical protein